MHTLNKTIKILTILCFVANTVFTGNTFGQEIDRDTRDNLAPASSNSGMIGIEHKDMGRIQPLLEGELLLFLKCYSKNADFRTFKKWAIKKDELIDEATLPAKIQLFDGEAVEKEDGIHVKCRIADKYSEEPRTYYAVFTLGADGLGGVSIKMYTEKEYDAARLPERSKEDQSAIAIYASHQAYDENVIKWAHEQAEDERLNITEVDLSSYVDDIIKRTKISIQGVDKIKTRKCYVVALDSLLYARIAGNPVIIKINGHTVKVTAYAHSSENAVHIFLPPDIIDAMKNDERKADQDKAREVFRSILAHEVGVMVGAPVLRTQLTWTGWNIPGVWSMSGHNGHFPINEIDERYSSGKKPHEKTYEVVNLDTNESLKTRDYAMGVATSVETASGFDWTSLKGEVETRTVQELVAAGIDASPAQAEEIRIILRKEYGRGQIDKLAEFNQLYFQALLDKERINILGVTVSAASDGLLYVRIMPVFMEPLQKVPAGLVADTMKRLREDPSTQNIVLLELSDKAIHRAICDIMLAELSSPGGMLSHELFADIDGAEEGKRLQFPSGGRNAPPSIFKPIWSVWDGIPLIVGIDPAILRGTGIPAGDLMQYLMVYFEGNGINSDFVTVIVGEPANLEKEIRRKALEKPQVSTVVLIPADSAKLQDIQALSADIPSLKVFPISSPHASVGQTVEQLAETYADQRRVVEETPLTGLADEVGRDIAPPGKELHDHHFQRFL